MKRRTVLQGAVALPLLSEGLASVLEPVAASEAFERKTMRRVRPSDAAWPSRRKWEQLKQAVGGHLVAVHPMFGTCGQDPHGPTCLDALANIHNPYWIGDQPAGTEVSGWLDAWTPAPSVYAIKARSAADVAAGIHFARQRRLRLAVKGGAHSYQGTSDAPDSLLIWTRSMNHVALHDAFIPRGCEGRADPVAAVTAGAGAVWSDLYYAVIVGGGRYVQGGSCTTVGVAGIVQSGGFNWFSKRFGTAASGLLEAEVVTADGHVCVVNECRYPELFWALKGGGGGTFGVVTRVTLRTYDFPKLIGSASIKLKAHSEAAFKTLVAHFLRFYRDRLFNPHWGNSVNFRPDNTLEISLVSEGLSSGQIEEIWRPFVHWVQSLPAHFDVISPFRAGAATLPKGANPFVGHDWIRDPRKGAPAYHVWNRNDQHECGIFLHGYDSLWLPASLLRHDQRPRFVEALFCASRHKQVQFQLNKGLAGAPEEARKSALETAMNPAVVDAFTLAIIADGQGIRYPGMPNPPLDLAAARRDARAIGLAAAELRKIVPKAGSYVSESNFFNDAWQEAFWGGNYPRLRAIKRKYDPDGLFTVHHGVGSEDWSADGFTRIS